MDPLPINDNMVEVKVENEFASENQFIPENEIKMENDIMLDNEFGSEYETKSQNLNVTESLNETQSRNETHSIKNININVSREFCQACLSSKENDNLKDMTKKHFYNGRYEIYSEMLDYCFSLQLERFEEENTYLICKPCILRLRDVVKFKSQVENAQKNIREKIGIATFLPTSYLDLADSVDSELVKIDREIASLINRQDNSDHPSFGNEVIPDENFIDISTSMPVSIQKNTKQNPKRSTAISRNDSKRKRPTPVGKRVVKIEYVQPPKLDADQVGSESTAISRNGSKRKRPTPVGKRVVKIENVQPPKLDANQLESKHALLCDSESNQNLSKSVQQRLRREKLLPYTLEPGQRQCKICNEEFDYHRGLRLHMPIHFPNFTCEICGRVFTNSFQFSLHKNYHGIPKYKCPMCPDKIFKTHASKATHIKFKHDHINRSRCPQCGERFPSHNKRQKHLVKVHGAAPDVYKCKICTVTFTTSALRSMHVRRIHLNERKYKCEICEYSGFDRDTLTRHMLIHTGERNFPCSVCKKQFKRKFTLKEHMKIHTGEKKHVCPVCSKAFTQKCTLKGHMTVHEDDKSNLAS